MSTPIEDRSTAELLAVTLAGLAELQRRLPFERLSTAYQRDSLSTTLHLLRRWHDGESARDHG